MGKNTSALTEAAAKLAALIPRERLDATVLAWSEASSRRRVWGVGFSGGADSLALLLLLWSHWPERRRMLRALHFDHRLRGAESRADAQFCRRVCAALKIGYVAGVWRGRHPGASEAEARAARMEFFRENARVIWLGHQQDDIAETMLMRLARGSGAGGVGRATASAEVCRRQSSLAASPVPEEAGNCGGAEGGGGGLARGFQQWKAGLFS